MPVAIRVLLTLFLVPLFAAAGPSFGQTAYPNKPIKLVIPFPPGGPLDLAGRAIGQKLQDAWGQPVVVENRPGAGGNIGADAVAKSAPDGYTLVMGALSTHAVNPHLFAPELPTMAEVGVAGFDISTWYGIMAPANTPPDIVRKLNTEIVKILGSDDMREKLKAQGAEPAPTSPEEFAAFIRAEWTKYAKIVKDSGAKVD